MLRSFRGIDVMLSDLSTHSVISWSDIGSNTMKSTLGCRCRRSSIVRTPLSVELAKARARAAPPRPAPRANVLCHRVPRRLDSCAVASEPSVLLLLRGRSFREDARETEGFL